MTDFRYDPRRPGFHDTLHDDYRMLRDEHPVYVDPEGAFAAVSRFDDVLACAADHRRFSSVVAEAQSFLPQMIFCDPPQHTAYRALVSKAFTPRRVTELEPMVQAVAHELCDALADENTVEVQHRYAAALPAIVVARLIGIPSDLIADFARWTESFLDVRDQKVFLENITAIYDAFRVLLDERRAAPTDDLMSALLAAEVDGGRLSTDEVLGFCMLLVLAGNDTTSSAIGNGIVLFADHPEQRARLTADPSLWSNAVEEILRIESPAQALPRTATVDVHLHGVTIAAGTRVMLVWGAANHDEREFPSPERFDVGRTIRRHLAFGHGIHHCLGAGLARVEARVGLQTFLERFPHHELADDAPWVPSHWARAHARVPVRLDGA